MNIKNKFFFILVALIVGLLTINGAFAETADSMPEIDQGTVSGDAQTLGVQQEVLNIQFLMVCRKLLLLR